MVCASVDLMMCWKGEMRNDVHARKRGSTDLPKIIHAVEGSCYESQLLIGIDQPR